MRDSIIIQIYVSPNFMLNTKYLELWVVYNHCTGLDGLLLKFEVLYHNSILVPIWFTYMIIDRITMLNATICWLGLLICNPSVYHYSL